MLKNKILTSVIAILGINGFVIPHSFARNNSEITPNTSTPRTVDPSGRPSSTITSPTNPATNPATNPSGRPSTTLPTNPYPNRSSPNSSSVPLEQNKQTAISSMDREFMIGAAQSNINEIASGQIAVKKANSAAIRDYAQKMIQEHTKANQELADIAQSKGISLPSEGDSSNKTVISNLEKLSGSEFDRDYMKSQVDAHKKTASLISMYQSSGSDREMMSYATKNLPVVQIHLKMAQSMNSDSVSSSIDGSNLNTTNSNRTFTEGAVPSRSLSNSDLVKSLQ